MNWPFLWAQLSGARLCDGDTPRCYTQRVLVSDGGLVAGLFLLKCYQF